MTKKKLIPIPNQIRSGKWPGLDKLGLSKLDDKGDRIGECLHVGLGLRKSLYNASQVLAKRTGKKFLGRSINGKYMMWRIK